MLAELIIENLAVIPEARLEFSPGLNIISGETGAGKTILAQAIALLLGARADIGLIRPGARDASVEAVFYAPAEYIRDISCMIDLEEDEDLSVRRRLNRDGRSRAYLAGRTANLSLLGDLTGRLMAFSAQHEQRRLMMASHQLEILDSFCGRQHLELKDEYRLLFTRSVELKKRLSELDGEAESLLREAELLHFQSEEIEAADLRLGEDDELEDERRRLRAAEELSAAAAAAAELLGSGGDEEAVPVAMSAILSRMDGLSGADRHLDDIAERLRSCYYELEDLGRSCRDYSEHVEQDPERLVEIEERLELIAGLKRKYGNSIEGIKAFGEEASRKLVSITGGRQEQRELSDEQAAVHDELLGMAEAIRGSRTDAAARLAEVVEELLAELAFSDSGFEVRLERIEGSGPMGVDALIATGADRVEFFVRLNPGMPCTPLSDTASGGELSRIMLAVKCAVPATGEAATMVFDEIDAGIGGVTGAAVGSKLKQLAVNSQVICITHLPQIACYADAHFSVIKHIRAGGEMTDTEVIRLEGNEVVDELCRMMGSRPEDSEARAHAGNLLRKAART